MALEIALGVLASGIVGAYKADKVTKESEARFEKQSKRTAKSKAEMLRKQQEVEDCLNKLVVRKKAVVTSSFNQFFNVMSKIKKIAFDEHDKIVKIIDGSKFDVFKKNYERIDIVTKDSMSDKKIIARLIFGPILSGPTALLYGNLAGLLIADAKLQSQKDEALIKESKAYRAYVENQTEALSALCVQLENLTSLVTKMNVLFLKEIKEGANLIEERGLNKGNYSIGDKKFLMNLFNLAEGMRIIIETPVFDKNNKLTNDIVQIIESNDNIYETYLQEIQNV